MTTVYLVRHGEAEGNLYRRCHGVYNSLLTPRGYQQIEKLAERFANIPVDRVYASDLFRAYQTAKAVADQKGLSIVPEPELREINMGTWEDKPWAELARFQTEQFAVWEEDPWHCTLPGGESVQQCGQRMLAAVRKIAAENPDKTVLIGTHGTVIRGLLCLAHGYGPDGLAKIGWGDNTSVSKLTIDGEALEIQYENDISHLPEELSTFHAVRFQGKAKDNQIWFRPVEQEDAEIILYFAKEKYQAAYGGWNDLDEGQYLADTWRMQRANPRAVTLGMLEMEPVALVRLNVLDTSSPDTGMVGSFAARPEYRGAGISPQMLGQAVSVYREMGKTYLAANAAENNLRAIGFYQKNGFEKIGLFQGHYRMRKKIAVC